MNGRAITAAVHAGDGVRLLGLLAALALVACGCGPSRTTEVIELRDGTEGRRPPVAMDGFDYLDYVLAESASDAPVYLPAAEARRCPRVKVATPGGKKTVLDFAERRATVVVIFWRPDVVGDIVAAELVDGLVEEYRGFGVRGFSLLRTEEVDDQGLQIARRGGALLDLYVDASGAAQRALAKAAGADDVTSLPAVCMIDRSGRVRHYRPKVSFALQASRDGGRARAGFFELGPPEQSVEAYLKRILGES
jgi:hypothetical protein